MSDDVGGASSAVGTRAGLDQPEPGQPGLDQPEPGQPEPGRAGLGWPVGRSAGAHRSTLGWPGAGRRARPVPTVGLGRTAEPVLTAVPVVTAEPDSVGEAPSADVDSVGDPVAAGGFLAAAPRRGDVSRETVTPDSLLTAGEVAATVPEGAVVRGQDQHTPLAVDAEREIRLVRAHAQREPPLERPARTRVLVVANQKGGVGKTTTAVNLAAGLSQRGQRVLLVDLDPQGNASTALGIEHPEGSPSVYEALIRDRPAVELVQPSPNLPGLTVLPAAIDLAGAEIDLVSLVARESRLRRALDAYLFGRAAAHDRLDYVFIDCPPSLGLLTVNALVAGEEVLVPIQCEYYALEGVGQLLRTVDMVRAHLNPGLQVSTILLTMHDARTRLSAGVADEVRRHFPEQVLRATIPRSVRISEAPSYQQTVLTYDPSSTGALCYLDAAREISARGPVRPIDTPAPPTGGRA